MPNMQTRSRRVRKHVKYILLFFVRVSLRSFKCIIFLPESLPLCLHLLERISSRGHCFCILRSCASKRGKSCSKSTRYNEARVRLSWRRFRCYTSCDRWHEGCSTMEKRSCHEDSDCVGRCFHDKLHYQI